MAKNHTRHIMCDEGALVHIGKRKCARHTAHSAHATDVIAHTFSLYIYIFLQPLFSGPVDFCRKRAHNSLVCFPLSLSLALTPIVTGGGQTYKIMCIYHK